MKHKVKNEYLYWNDEKIIRQHSDEKITDDCLNSFIQFFDIKAHTTGLELGCGNGPFARRLKDKKSTICGLDFSFDLLQRCENMLPVQGSALNLPFKNESFHWIIIAFSLHHMVNIKRVIKEIGRVLAKEGKIYLVEPNYYHPIRYITRKPGTFARRHLFKDLSPEEKWIPTHYIKKIFKKYDILTEKLVFCSPEYTDLSMISRIQLFMSKILNFGILKRFVHSYYYVEAKKIR